VVRRERVETTGGVFQVREGRARAAGWGGAASDAVTSCHLLRSDLRDEIHSINRYGAAATTPIAA
jgi:hypothetical protein